MAFNEKFDRARTELEAVGLRWQSNFVLKAMNEPFYAINRFFRLKPLHFASYPEMWLRSFLFFFVLSILVAFVMLLDKSQIYENEFWISRIIGAIMFATVMPFLYKWQAKRWKLTLWQDI